MNVSLPTPMKDWVDAQIEGGQYASASDYVRDLIRRDQLKRDKREALIQALIDGEESGVSPRQVPEIWARLKREMAESSDG
ncbi:MAG: type II toxin-antitoxin system ParD family antitoxin [Geminicoccaceae bacterium]